MYILPVNKFDTKQKKAIVKEEYSVYATHAVLIAPHSTENVGLGLKVDKNKINKSIEKKDFYNFISFVPSKELLESGIKIPNEKKEFFSFEENSTLELTLINPENETIVLKNNTHIGILTLKKGVVIGIDDTKNI